MSHDEHGHAKEPIIMTSGRRMGKGLAIVVVTLAIGAAILIPFFDAMFAAGDSDSAANAANRWGADAAAR